jgi:hypothetical protein
MKVYRSKHTGPVSYGTMGQSINLTEGQEFDEGSDVLVARPDLFEFSREKPETSLNAAEAEAGGPLPAEETGQPLLPGEETSTKPATSEKPATKSAGK